MHNLYLFILSTSLYNQYKPFFFRSLENFKLKNFNVNLIVVSDENNDSQLVPRNINNIYYYPIAHLPYPFVTYSKPLTVEHAIKHFSFSDYDYMMFVDADTIIRRCDDFDNFEQCLLTNKMIFNISPWFLDHYKTENDLCRDEYQEVYIENIKNTDFIQTSFFAGNIKAYHEFCKKYYDVMQEMTKDWKCKRIPPMIDQSIINKLVHDEQDLYVKDNFLIDYYVDISIDESLTNDFSHIRSCNNTFKIDNFPNVFLIQKFNQNIKAPIRFSI